MSEEVSLWGRDARVECPECGRPVRFVSTEDIVECPVFDGPSGCGARFTVTVSASVVL